MVLTPHFADSHTNRKKTSIPTQKIDNLECQQSLPRRAMGFGFHSGLLSALYQFPRSEHAPTRNSVMAQFEARYYSLPARPAETRIRACLQACHLEPIECVQRCRFGGIRRSDALMRIFSPSCTITRNFPRSPFSCCRTTSSALHIVSSSAEPSDCFIFLRPLSEAGHLKGRKYARVRAPVYVRCRVNSFNAISN